MYSVIRQAPGRLPTKRIVQPVVAIMISLKKSPFISYVEEHFFEDKWSLDVCVHRALKDASFIREQIVCTKTLYNYADLGLRRIKNIDLPEKLRRSPKKTRVLKNKRILGRSIEERPSSVEDCAEFGHWEADLVIGSKSDKNGLIRRFIPKGRRIDSFSDEQICQIEVWCNSLPRKILVYSTPDELFEEELDRIYTIAV